MLKRKYGDRTGWKRILDREFRQMFLDTEEFTGNITLLKIHKVIEPSFVQYRDKRVCIVDDGYYWLQHFPKDQHYSVTTMFDARGKIIQWYIDICKENGIENDRPWMDDLFLDIVVLPTGEMFLKDADELEEALEKGMIDGKLYQMAWKEANQLSDLIRNEQFSLLGLSKEHMMKLLHNGK
ncbi:DUF402 domain-containing protein [Lederbergia sp. NSJ-179]|uniref:DUF402 domain-containing protein n=1 Tax=Lederbergia sp. NSJ-179 TaxID=2931402 RepID=UPI001FD0B025|nr:DUF402 domain-containing protein [Lederbergia sp. NSJ-179]MCJ7839793.1 DUF402 domain-containing protein [Lederbergia sp. NSJ-179]